MTRHCFKCGWEYKLPGQPGRSESCPQCGSDLKVCLNCFHYDSRAAYQCKEKRAEPVQDKHMANFCEYFEFAKREFKPNTEEIKREQAAREKLRKLFGD